MQHKTVLLHEAIDGLDIKKGDIFVDGTLGGGGHTEEVCKRLSSEKDNNVVMIAVDLDSDAIQRATARLAKYQQNIKFVQGSFRDIDKILDTLGVAHADKILLDIGLSSNQFEDSGRGFSFQKDEPLIMSFKKEVTESDLTAKEILNVWDLENVVTILRSYGEEQFAWKIAKAIVARREIRPILTTFDLVEIIKLATPKWYSHKKLNPATKTFQALRITVNDEIENIKIAVRAGFQKLNPKGRMAVISFHSLEDREVKRFYKEMSDKGLGTLVTKKPTVPTEEETKENPRSRSAKLRIIEKS